MGKIIKCFYYTTINTNYNKILVVTLFYTITRGRLAHWDARKFPGEQVPNMASGRCCQKKKSNF